MTIRPLVNMTSGIGDFFGPEFEATPKNLLRHNRDYLKLFASKPLAFEPGAKQMYSNDGYIVLGEIISAASKMDYYDYVREKIFKPAGMKDSDWFEADAVVPNVAEGYTKRTEEPEDAAGTVQSKDKSDKPSTTGPEVEIRPGNNNQPDEPGPQSANQVGKASQQNFESYPHNFNETPNKSQAKINDISGAENPGNQKSEIGNQPQKLEPPAWHKNIYTRPARGSAAGGGYATAEDLLRFIQALYECRLLDEPWTNWVFTGLEPEESVQGKKIEENLGGLNENIKGRPDLDNSLKNNDKNTKALQEYNKPKIYAFLNQTQTQDTRADFSYLSLPEIPLPDLPKNYLKIESAVNPSSKEIFNGSSYNLSKTGHQTSQSEINSPNRTIDRTRWNLGLAGGAPGINATLEFEGQTGFTIIVLSNYDPPSATQVGKLVRRYFQAAKK